MNDTAILELYNMSFSSFLLTLRISPFLLTLRTYLPILLCINVSTNEWFQRFLFVRNASFIRYQWPLLLVCKKSLGRCRVVDTFDAWSTARSRSRERTTTGICLISKDLRGKLGAKHAINGGNFLAERSRQVLFQWRQNGSGNDLTQRHDVWCTCTVIYDLQYCGVVVGCCENVQRGVWPMTLHKKSSSPLPIVSLTDLCVWTCTTKNTVTSLEPRPQSVSVQAADL